MKHLIVSTTLLVILPSALVAEGEPWTDREICHAATKTCFFLDTKPDDAPDKGDRFGFRSRSGNTYTCQIEGETAAFYWVNKSGQDMESKSTNFSVNGDLLHIKTDMLEEDFTLE